MGNRDKQVSKRLKVVFLWFSLEIRKFEFNLKKPRHRDKAGMSSDGGNVRAIPQLRDSRNVHVSNYQCCEREMQTAPSMLTRAWGVT